MQKVKLNNGIDMPILGYGFFDKRFETNVNAVYSDALEVGYRFIDTAASYGNEVAVGNTIKKKRHTPRRYIYNY